MHDIPNYIVTIKDSGRVAYTDDGAAIEETLEDAVQARRVVANLMNWDTDALEIKQVELAPVADADLPDPT